MAGAGFQLTISGQPTAVSQVNDSDPVALSGSLGVDSNIQLVAGFASAAADSTAGTVRVRSTGLTKMDGAGFPNVSAGIDDKITFHGPGPTVQVQIKGTVDGVFLSGGSGIGFLQQVAAAQLSAGSFNTSAQFERDYTTSETGPAVETFITTILTPAPDAGYVKTFPTTGPEAASLEIDAAFAVEVPIQVGLTATAQLGGQGAPMNVNIDDSFGNTARLTITLPDGYTFTSKGGVFLSNQGAPGLALPPDGGPGVHGTGSDGGIAGSGDGGRADGDAGGGSNADNGGSSSSGGCNSAGSAATGSFSIFAVAGLSMLYARRRRARRNRARRG